MHLMTSKRAIAAAHAKVHVHHQEIHTVDDPCGDLFFGSVETNAADAPHPTTFYQDDFVGWFTFLAKQMRLAINHELPNLLKAIDDLLVGRRGYGSSQILKHSLETVRAIRAVKRLSKLRKLAQQT